MWLYPGGFDASIIFKPPFSPGNGNISGYGPFLTGFLQQVKWESKKIYEDFILGPIEYVKSIPENLCLVSRL